MVLDSFVWLLCCSSFLALSATCTQLGWLCDRKTKSRRTTLGKSRCLYVCVCVCVCVAHWSTRSPSFVLKDCYGNIHSFFAAARPEVWASSAHGSEPEVPPQTAQNRLQICSFHFSLPLYFLSLSLSLGFSLTLTHSLSGVKICFSTFKVFFLVWKRKFDRRSDHIYICTQIKISPIKLFMKVLRESRQTFSPLTIVIAFALWRSWKQGTNSVWYLNSLTFCWLWFCWTN